MDSTKMKTCGCLHNLMKSLFAGALNSRSPLALISSSYMHNAKKKILRTYAKVVSYHLITATVDVTGKVKAILTCYTELSGYVAETIEALWLNQLGAGKFTMGMWLKVSSFKGLPSPSVTECNRNPARIQGKSSTTWLVTRGSWGI